MSLAPEGSSPGDDVVFVASYQDEDYAFTAGSWARFGRDDTRCQITVWEELRGTALSRVAGELWCVDGEEMWVRNLSSTHELTVTGADGPPQVLAPRTAGQRGRACSVPVPHGVIAAPSTGRWQLFVRQTAETASTGPSPVDNAAPETVSVGPVPPDLRDVAAALCAPMLLRGDPPASYLQVAAALGLTGRQARRRVERLCEHYAAQAPALLPSTTEGQALYVPVAQLLVTRGRVTRDDLGVLAAPATGSVE